MRRFFVLGAGRRGRRLGTWDLNWGLEPQTVDVCAP